MIVKATGVISKSNKYRRANGASGFSGAPAYYSTENSQKGSFNIYGALAYSIKSQGVSCRSSLNGTPAYYSTLMAQNPFWVVPPTEPTLRPANDLRS